MEGTKWDAESQPCLRRHKQIEENGDGHQLRVAEKEVPFAQQVWSSSVKQEVPEPFHIKKEEQLQGLDEADITKRSTTRVNGERGPAQSRLHHSEREKNRKVVPASSSSTTKADGNQRSGLDSHLSPLPDEDVESDSSESDDAGEAQQPLKSKGDSKGGIWDNKPQIVCGVCRQSFQMWPHLRAHMTTHFTTQITPTGEKTFSCSFCDKIYSKKQTVTRHVKIHAAEKQFSCSECGKYFTCSQHLSVHMRVHTGERPFACSVCGKRCSTQTNILVHMRTHTGEKPFSCSVCSRTFSSMPGLNSHMLTHTGEKPFSCSVCTEGFVSKGNLERHMRIHTGERPFACSVCGLKFVQKEHLVAHMRTHTGVKLFSCAVCNRKFSREQQADKHKCTSENSNTK